MMHLLKQISFSLIFFLFSFSYAHAQTTNQLLHEARDPYVGNPKGKVTIVEFFDYQCSHCIEMGPVLSSIVKANPHVRIIFKEFPIRGPVSAYASRVALAANMQNKYKTFHHALLNATQPLTEASVMEIAKASGLNMTKLKNDIKSPTIKQHLAANEALAKTLKITGTPAYFIAKSDAKNLDNVDFILGEMSQNELQKAIEHVQK